MAEQGPFASVADRARAFGIDAETGVIAGCFVALVGLGATFLYVRLTGHAASAAWPDLFFIGLSAVFALLLAAMARLVLAIRSERFVWQAEWQKMIEAHQSGFDSASDAIVVLGDDGTIVTLNKAAEKMFGRPRDVLGGSDAAVLFDLDQSSGPMLQRLNTTSDDLNIGIHREMQGRRNGEDRFPIDVTFRELLQPDVRQVVGFVRDISDRKRVEKLKDEFVSTVNHELRTPLTSIAGSLGLLAGGAGGELPPGAARLIGIAHANCQRLIRLINDILDVEKIESGKMRFEMVPLELPEIVGRAIESLQGYADQLGVRVSFAASGTGLNVRADADRIVQVLTNLISNAVKFSPKGGEVVVSTKQVGLVARLCVSDAGPGIPDEFRARIFTKFAQADSSDTRQKGGTGLGLVIAKEITERHGGRLWFESEMGQGTRFYVDLPLLKESKPEITADARKTILICEDDFDVAAVLREMLERDGHRVEYTASGREAQRKLQQSPARYAALVLDLVLPDGDGIELIRALRTHRETSAIPVIVVSAEADRGRNGSGANALNVVDWIGKPIDLERLKTVVRSVTSKIASARPFVLHVEDDPDLLQLTASALGGFVEIVAAESLARARVALSSRRPDLVILDICLGDGSGLELLPDLRDNDGRLIPVIVFSARDVDQQVLHQVEAVLTKSKTSLPELADTVAKLLSEAIPRKIAV